MSNSQIPVARSEGLVIQELPGEVLVYDLETNKAHCLNRTAAAVWKSCDGKNSVADISRLLAEETSGDVPVQEDLIRLAIDRLNESDLLENKPAANFSNQNRREVIKKYRFGGGRRAAAGYIPRCAESGSGGQHL